MAKLIGYLRVSTDKQAEEGLGLDVQRAKIKAWAKANSHKVVAWYTDEGISGSNGVDTRKALGAALEALKPSGIGGLVVYRLDRLARDVILQETLLKNDIRPYGALFSTVPSEQDVMNDDPSDPGRKMVRVILGAVADYERELIKLRLSGGRAAKAARGGYAYGAPPLGKRAEGKELVPDEREQAAIARMRELHSRGRSLRQIVAALEEEGHQTKRGGHWYPATVNRVLAR
jgi:DNA invertase Pin-like site-specific DNA recombinase